MDGVIEGRAPVPNSPLVSVVIPTYNRSRLLMRALESVLSQEGVALEVTVVDDGSTDDTEEAVARLDDPRIRFVSHAQNLGGSAARNTGIGMATGGYVAFLDSDDEWLPGKAASQAALLVARPEVGVVYCGFRTVDEGMALTIEREVEVHRGDLFNDLLGGWCPDTTSMTMVRRDLLIDVGAFDAGLTGFQDYDLLLRLSRLTELDLVEKPLVVKHEHGGGQLTTDTDGRLRALDVFMNKWRTEIERVHGPEAVARVRSEQHRRIVELSIVQALRSGRRLTAWRHYPLLLRLCLVSGISLSGIKLCLSPLPGLVFGFRTYARARRALRRLQGE